MAALQYADGAKISDLGPDQAQVGLVRVPPTKDQGGRGELHKRILRMKGLSPLFTDFTWAAGGSTSKLKMKLTSAAKNEMGSVACMHLTCTNMKGVLVSEALAVCKKDGVRNIVALRGDPPCGQKK